MTASTVRIVIIEDMDETRRVLAGLLAHLPRVEVVATAGDATEVSRAVSTTQPDLVLVDYNLGHGVRGPERIDAFRETCPRCRFVVTSADDSREVADKVADHGAYAFIPKRNLRQMVASIRSMVDQT